MPVDGLWQSEDLTAASRSIIHAAVMSKISSAEQSAKTSRNLGFLVGAAGTALAVLMGIATTAVFLKKPVPPPPGFLLIDKTSGWIGPTMLASDATKVLSGTEAANEKALRDYITNCEGYLPETWARVNGGFHACMIMSSPDEQHRRNADIGKDGPRYPPNFFGPKGWAQPEGFLSFTRQADGDHQTLHYEVRYERTEIANSRESHVRYTAHVHFQWHPELEMNAQDRLINPAGFTCISFSTTKD